MKYIYIYTTESFRAKGWYKIGESIRHPNKRIAEQDIASSPEPLLFIHSWVVDNSITDKSIHELLELSGFNRLRKGREWFELSNNPIEDINVIMAGLGQGLVKSHTIHSGIVYDIPNFNDLWWANKPKESSNVS